MPAVDEDVPDALWLFRGPACHGGGVGDLLGVEDHHVRGLSAGEDAAVAKPEAFGAGRRHARMASSMPKSFRFADELAQDAREGPDGRGVRVALARHQGVGLEQAERVREHRVEHLLPSQRAAVLVEEHQRLAGAPLAEVEQHVEGAGVAASGDLGDREPVEVLLAFDRRIHHLEVLVAESDQPEAELELGSQPGASPAGVIAAREAWRGTNTEAGR